MKQVSSKIKLELAQYRELAAFAQFGSELDKDTKATLEHGERLMEILKQPQYEPMSVDHQVLVIYAVVNKYMADIAVKDIHKFEKELINYLDVNAPEIGKSVTETGKLSEEMEEKLKTSIQSFKASFVVD